MPYLVFEVTHAQTGIATVSFGAYGNPTYLVEVLPIKLKIVVSQDQFSQRYEGVGVYYRRRVSLQRGTQSLEVIVVRNRGVQGSNIQRYDVMLAPRGDNDGLESGYGVISVLKDRRRISKYRLENTL